MGSKWLLVVVAALAVAVAGCPNMGDKAEDAKGTVEIRTPDATQPKVVTPKVVEPKVTKPKVEEPKVTKPKVTKPKVEEPKVTKPKVTKPKVEEPKVTKPKVVEPKVTTPKVTTPKVEPATPAIKNLKPGLDAVDLSGMFNSDGITSDDNRGDSDFDEWKQSYPAEALPDAGTFTPEAVKTAFLFPAKDAGKKNNIACAGQTIPLAGKAKALHVLATATDGNQEATVTVAYADGTVQKDLKVTDWCAEAAFGEKPGVVSTHRVAVDDQGSFVKEEKKTRIWVVAIPLDAKRELKSVKLPYNGSIHVFALTLAR